MAMFALGLGQGLVLVAAGVFGSALVPYHFALLARRKKA
jgi:hypothetical protein